MKGLLIKDLYGAENYKRSYLILLVFSVGYSLFTKDSGAYLVLMLGIMTMMAVYSSFSYDEYYHWDRFSMALPLKRSTIVASKYVFVMLAWLSTVVLAVIIAVIQLLVFKNAEKFNAVLISGVGTTTAYVMGILMVIPLVFKLGMEKVRILGILIMMVPFFAFVLFSNAIDHLIWGYVGKTFALLAICAGAILATAIVSYKLAVKAVLKKDY